MSGREDGKYRIGYDRGYADARDDAGWVIWPALGVGLAVGFLSGLLAGFAAWSALFS